jgi:3-isopropylmalate dehydrogenase
MPYKIAVVAGDGIGPDVVREGMKILKRIGERFNRTFVFHEALVGGAALDETGTPLPDETLLLCKTSDAVLLGAVGGPKWDGTPPERKPEQALLGLRKQLGLYANLRPARIYPALVAASTLKADVVEGADILVVRELTGGLYFGTPRGIEQRDGERVAINTLIYSTSEIKRIAHQAFNAARKRRKKVCSVDKANILETSQLWREVVTHVATEYPDVELSHMYVDNCAMQLIRHPRQFDVIVTENMFGDILSDEAAMLTGSIGMLPSASLGGTVALYEPVHGSAPDIAGTDKANPIATIASVALMLRYSFNLEEEARCIEGAIEQVLSRGFRTPDISSRGDVVLGTVAMGDAIAGCI